MFNHTFHPPGSPHFRVIALQRSRDPDQAFAPCNQRDDLVIHLIHGDSDSGELFPVSLGAFIVSVICGHVHDSIEPCSPESILFLWECEA
jgi:hypothetical protein